MTYSLEIKKKIKAAPEEVYTALTDERLLSKWFTSNAVSDTRVGGRYSNDDRDEGEYLELVPFSSIRFTWENKDHCPGTEVVIYIKEENGCSEVILCHEKLPSEAGRNDMNTGWTWAMESLRSFLEEGKPVKYEEWKEKNSSSPVD